MKSAFSRIVYLLTLNGWRNVVLLAAGMALVGIFEVVGVASILPFIAVASRPELIEQQPQLHALYQMVGSETPMQFLAFLGVTMIVLLVLANGTAALVNWSLLTFTHRRGHEISAALLSEYMAKPYLYFVTRNSSVISKTILAQVSQVVNSVLIPSLQLMARAVVLSAMLALLLAVNPLVTLVVFGGLGSCYVFIFLAMRRYIIRLGQEVLKADGERHKAVAETLGGIKEVKLYGADAFFLKRFLAPSSLVARHMGNKEALGLMPRYILEIFAFCAMVSVVLFLLAKEQSLTEVLPVLALYALVAARMLPTFQQLFHSITVIRFSAPAMGDICDALQARKPASSVAASPLPLSHEIQLENVSFTYPEKAVAIIQNVSLVIPARKITALVGATGSGKSTITDLITGIIVPQSGRITIDGKPLTAENTRAWQLGIGYVPQHIFLIDDTVRRNIAFGVDDANIDDAAVRRAAQMAQIDEFISGELQHGYDTMVGERGIRLSGGQRQRLGLARALYHNPQLLVLDEATSALDNVTERSVMDAIHALGGSKTVIIIAHRLSTVKQCDHIVLVREGEIEAQGTYDALLQNSQAFQKQVYAFAHAGEEV